MDPRVEHVLEHLSLYTQQCFGDHLVGFYLHGSAAMGCFHWQTGDIDCLVVVEGPLPELRKLHFIEACLRLMPICPPKGIEISVVTRVVCGTPFMDNPFEVHFSPLYAEAYKRNVRAQLLRMPETDPDLVAHFAMVRSRGLTLLGPPADEIFTAVPRKWLLESLENDLADAEQAAKHHPVYYVLNYCRALAFLEEGLFLSKAEGATWGLDHLPEVYAPLLRNTLKAYTGGKVLAATGMEVIPFIRAMKRRWLKGRNIQDGRTSPADNAE